MNNNNHNYAAVAVLPPVSGGRLEDASLRAWLSRSNIRLLQGRRALLSQVLDLLGLPQPEEGFAALRMWGQTGDRPTVWLAAADPVCLEPRLDRLCLHALRENDLQPTEFRALFDHLQSLLAGDSQTGFVQLGNYGYLRDSDAIATAAVPPAMIDQESPGDYLPKGAGAARHRNLLSEIEMSLHDHEVNQRRIAAGKKPVNSLWLWGGGFAPERTTRVQPPLFTEDPLLLGYWDSANATANRWPGSIEQCIEAAGESFVAVAPYSEDDPHLLTECLGQLRDALENNRIRRLSILFRDGRLAEIRQAHRLRFWRRESPLLA